MSGKKSKHCTERDEAIRREHDRRTRLGIETERDGQTVLVMQKSYEAARDMVAWVRANWGDDLRPRTIQNIVYKE